MPVVFGHFMGTELDDNWRLLLAEFKLLRDIYVHSRTMIAPHSPFMKSFCDYDAVTGKSKLFLNPVDVNRIMCETLAVH